MGVIDSVGAAHDRYCRRLTPAEAGALWCLADMAAASRVRGVVKARWTVFGTAMNCEATQAEELVRSLEKKGAATVTAAGFGTDAVVVGVGMFTDVWERRRARERSRKAVTA